MSAIARYVFRQIIGPFMAFAFIFTAVIWLSQSLRMLDVVINQSHSVGAYLYVTILAMPQVFSLVLPFALFCAVLYALNRLYVESELVVIWATGFSHWSIIGPIIAVACVGTTLGLVLNLILMPAGMRQMKDKIFEIRTDIANTFVREGAFTNPASGITVFVTEANQGGDIHGILVHDARNPKSTITYMAKRGMIADTSQGPRLIMYDGSVQWLDRDQSKLKMLSFKQYTFDISQFATGARSGPRDVSERYLNELLHPEAAANEDARRKYYADAHGRLSVPLYNIVLALVAGLSLVGGTFNRRGYAGRMGIGMGVALVARLPGFLFQQMTYSHPNAVVFMYAWPAAWILLLLYLVSTPDDRFERRVRAGRGVSSV